jgi:shikimate O-hydroxycinnamoyltransferase
MHSPHKFIITRQQPIFVKPAVASTHQIIELSPFDNLAPTSSFHFQFVYKNEKNDPNFMNPDSMKSSLSKLLVEFPLVAGTARVEDGKWSIECNDIGVPLYLAHTDMKLDDFDMTDYDQLPQNICTQWTGPQDPVWQIQITYFKCGGVMLVSELLHQIGDGETNSNLMHTWTKIHSNQTYVPPVLDRTLIRPSANSPPTSFPQWHQSNDSPNFEELFAKLPLCTAKCIEFSAEEIQLMKQSATPKNNIDVPWISSNDALCSHMWRLITKARGLSGNTTTSLLHSCNVRSKMQPLLPSGKFISEYTLRLTISDIEYVGYVIMNGQTERIPCNELLQSPLSHAAAISRRTINEITPEYVQKFVDWISVTDKVKPSDMNVLFGTDVFGTSWVSFDLYSVVFENGEAPYFAGEIPTILDGVFKLVEGRRKGSISIQLSLLREHMEKLLVDPELHFISLNH